MLTRAWKRAACSAAAAVVLTLAVGASAASAQQSALIGRWQCAGERDGMTYASSFDYQPDGSYISTQRISAGTDFIEGGGGGAWRLEGNVLYDTKLIGRLDRFVRGGVNVPRSDPEFQSLVAQSQSNLGSTTSGEIRIVGDVLFSGIYTCQRQR